jgi:hypothetical protein
MILTLLVAFSELATLGVRAAGDRPARPHIELVQTSPKEGGIRLDAVEPLSNPRTGVTCTMRILKAEPVDKGGVIPLPEPGVDPEIRGRVSPCLD